MELMKIQTRMAVITLAIDLEYFERIMYAQARREPQRARENSCPMASFHAKKKVNPVVC